MKPLEGVKIIDFTQAHAGSAATMLLSDFGAEVIKIERKGTGDIARAWEHFCRAIDMTELLEDERFTDNTLRCKNYETFTAEVLPYFAKHTKAELQEIFTNAKIPNAPVLTIPEIMQHQQIKDREMLVMLHDDGVGTYHAVNNPMKLSKTPVNIRKGTPLLGQHTKQVFEEFGFLPNT